MARIYVSSTYQDLKAFRQEVSRAIRQLGHEDVAMEYYVAEPRRPLDRCLDDVRRCDLYVGLFAWRYGYVPPGSERSITEREFREALRFDRPVLCFLLAEDAPWPERYKEQGPGRRKLDALRAEIQRDFLCATFTSPEQLAAEVTAAIARWERPAATPPDPEREHRLMKLWTSSPSRLERNRARQALVNMGSSRYASAIKELLLQRQADVDELHFYLGELLQISDNSPEAMPVLLDLLHAPDPGTRVMAVFHIGELGLKGRAIKPAVVRALLALGADTEPAVRAEVAHALGKLRHPDPTPPDVLACLAGLAQDPDPAVRERAEDSLRLLRP
jgi:hypothetical protein